MTLIIIYIIIMSNTIIIIIIIFTNFIGFNILFKENYEIILKK